MNLTRTHYSTILTLQIFP